MNTQIKFTTAAEAVKVIKSGDHIHLSSVASAPQCLIKAMCERGANHEFKDVHIHHLHTEGPAPYADPQFEGIFQLDSFFVGGNVRKVTQSGYADYIPIFLSETQKLYRSGTVPCDVAMIQVSTPDKHGYVSLGTSVDATLAAVETARTVIAVVNKHVPRSFGDAMIHSSKIDLFVQDDTPLEEAHFTEPNEIETRIGKHCAALIEDGATLQMGIGAIPNAVLAQLGNHKNLGIHTEMFADGVLPLVEKGVINGEAKNIDKGKMVSTFLMGSQRVYDFIDDNPGVLMMDVGYTNDPFIIAKIYNDDLLERVRDITQRIELLRLFFFRSHVICNLDIVSLVSLIHHKVNLQLLANTFALFILIEDIHDTHINIVATDQQLVINNVLHDMSRLLLSEIQTCISQSQIRKVVFQICTDILSALNIVSACLGNQKGICQIVDMLGDGFISISHLTLTGKGIGNL